MLAPRTLCLLGLASGLLPILPLQAQQRSAVQAYRDAPARIERTSSGSLFVDFGRAAFGNLEIDTSSVPAGTKVVIHLGENLSAPQTVHRRPGGTVRYQRHELTLDSRRNPATPRLTWAPPGWMKDGWLDLPARTPEFMPFRYAEIENAPPSLSAAQIRRVRYQIPFTPDASHFSSSSPELDAVWDFCRHTIEATTAFGLYIDGDRERKPYEADVLINQLGHYCLDANYETARLSHEYLLEKPTWPTEWRLQSVILAWHDFLWSGDDRSLRRHYPVLKRRAMIERRTADGLFEGWNQGPVTDIVDWPAGERDGYDMSPAVKTAVTAFHYRSLVLLEKIATHLGRSADAKEFGGLAAQTALAVNQRLWDESKGAYLDGLDPRTGKTSTHASAHASFFALSLGLVPPDRQSRVAAFLKSRGMACSVYGSQFLLDALYDAGEADHAFSLLTSNGLRSWRNMFEKVGSTIALEAWDPSLKPNLDWNHPWGAAPSNLIPRRLMGVEPLEPGFRRFQVRPQTSRLTRARLKLPTPLGPIHLDLQGNTASDWTARIVVPKGSAAEFVLPFPGQPVVEKDGKAQVPRILPERFDRSVIGLTPGSWTLKMKN